jgi:anaerobic magnesium-protoporphyrin IX monomethyl ester cyclase
MSQKAKVALINPPTVEGVYYHQLYVPIGLAYLAAVVEKAEHDLIVIDCPALQIDLKMLKKNLEDFQPDLVGITCMTPTIQSALQSARAAKQACPDATVVIGGPHATFMDEQILNDEPSVDIVVRGEGEESILELAQTITGLKKLQDILGITFRIGRENVKTPNRPSIENLDALPLPAYKFFPLNKYRIFGKLYLPVITSRGCPFQCAYCTTSRVLGKKYRSRRPKNIVDELEFLKNTYHADAFTFYDDTLTLDKARIFEICDEMKARQINIPWDCQTRVDQISKEILQKMKQTGCQQVFFGVESGCQTILDAVNKRTTVEQNEKAIQMAKKAGLFVSISIIIGYPGETPEMLKQTFDFIRRAEPDDVCLCIATPYPGTELRRIISEKGWKMSPDWSRYDTVKPVFENPNLSEEEIDRLRTKFYDSFYSPKYILKHLFSTNRYSKAMARSATNHILWRINTKYFKKH